MDRPPCWQDGKKQNSCALAHYERVVHGHTDLQPGSLLPIHSCQYRCYIWGFAPPTGKVTRSLVYRDCPGSPSCIWIFLELPPRSLDHFLGILNEPFCWTMPVQLRIGSQEPLQFLPARGWSTAGDAMIAPQD